MSELNNNVEEVIEEVKEEVQNGVHNYSAEEDYIAPTQPKVLANLETFQDRKIALMMHWGPYAQIGLVESWALSDQDADWSRTDVDWGVNDEEFKQQYKDLNKTFNPIRFNPEEWADLAEEGGFKYFIFTTKHHDGFCMWDTKYSDYKITGEDCPFHTHKYADVCRYLFEAMRKRGIGVTAYFSKADWHVPSYWAPDTERGNFMWRGPSYKPEENPELWEEFVQFTHNQLIELTTQYGKIDALWFDAGWVCEQSGQDIRLGEAVEKCRKIQPWLLSVDRTIGGAYENYVTPEQCIPERPLTVPWESNITIGTSFAYKFEDDYKSVRELVDMVVNVVAKGGNIALNVGPQPDGRVPRPAIQRIKGLGAWLKEFGECIYGTRVCEPHFKDGIGFTKKDNIVYAIKVYVEENQKVEQEVFVPYAGKVNTITLVGTNASVAFEQVEGGLKVTLPEAELNAAPIAHVFKMN